MHDEAVQVVRLLPEPAMLLGSDGRILAANEALAGIVGVHAGSLSGIGFPTLLRDPLEKADEYLRLCARSRQLIPGAFDWITRDGGSLQMRCDGALLAPRSNGAPAVLFLRCRPKAEATDHFSLLNRKIAALSQEILERKKAERERDRLLHSEREARVEAERVNRLKDEFLASVSHELRTPLNAILGWSHVLQNPGADPQRSQGLQAIERNARAQAQIIGDLLDMSSIVSGKMRLEVQTIAPAEVVESALESVRPACEAKNIRLHVLLDPLAGPIKGDPARLQQVLWNLLSNAVKFTPKNGRIQVLLERVNSHIEISVVDDGQGIAPEFLPHVFERFRQADGSSTRRHGGLGLGLAIVKHLVEMHGGAVRAKSAGAGQGATFTVALPLIAVQQESDDVSVHPRAPSHASVQLPADLLQGLSVLVVDDEHDARALLAALIEERRGRVLTADSAEAALTLFAERRADIVLCDIGMPGRDGYAFVKALRALPDGVGERVPVVAVTAFARSEDRARAMLAGFDAHLAKPLEPTELLATIARLARRILAPRPTSGADSGVGGGGEAHLPEEPSREDVSVRR